MMKRKIVNSLAGLRQDVISRASCDKNSVAIIAGHYAIDQEARPLIDEQDAFGIFPKYTFRLGCEAAIISNARLVILVDDHSQFEDKEWYLQGTDQTIEDYFEKFRLPEEYSAMLKQCGLEEEIFIRSRYGFAFQESRYRLEYHMKTGQHPTCAGEYGLILEELADSGIRSLISFIPLICYGPTCRAVEHHTHSRLKISTIYLPTHQDNTDPELLEKNAEEMFGGIPILSKRGIIR